MISHVFVVDDERVIASTLATILTMSGYDARFFDNPLEALEAARKVKPDLLISDVMMPEMSGIDLAIRMKEQYPNCKVLLFSGQPETAKLLEGASEQGHDFHLVTKPIHPAALLARIKDSQF
jgi:DNA-binding response OmpR family regulator